MRLPERKTLKVRKKNLGGTNCSKICISTKDELKNKETRLLTLERGVGRHLKSAKNGRMFCRSNATSFWKTLSAFQEIGKEDNWRFKSNNTTEFAQNKLIEAASDIPKQKGAVFTSWRRFRRRNQWGRTVTASFWTEVDWVSYFQYFEWKGNCTWC